MPKPIRMFAPSYRAATASRPLQRVRALASPSAGASKGAVVLTLNKLLVNARVHLPLRTVCAGAIS